MSKAIVVPKADKSIYSNRVFCAGGGALSAVRGEA